MKIAKKLIYLTGAALCSTLAITLRTIALPIALIYVALDAMAKTSDSTGEAVVKALKSKNIWVNPICN